MGGCGCVVGVCICVKFGGEGGRGGEGERGRGRLHSQNVSIVKIKAGGLFSVDYTVFDYLHIPSL